MLMRKRMIYSVLATGLMAAMGATAAETAQLRLTGTITPAACVPVFAGGGSIDYGAIAASTLNTTAQTTLPDKYITFSVTCDAPVKFAFTVRDERNATTVTSLETIEGASASGKYGLGTAANGVKIGAYSMKIGSETSNEGVARRLGSVDGGATWQLFGGSLNKGPLYGFGNCPTATVPAALTAITMTVRIVAAIDKAENLPITDEISIDGLTTFEVKYL
jgi:hypothetical protein